MKILFVSTSSGSRGGGELAMIPLAAELKRRGHVCSLWLSDHAKMDGIAEKFAPVGEVVRAPYTNTYDLPLRSLQAPFRRGTVRRVAAQLRGLAPDVIHLNKQNLEDGLDLVDAVARTGLPRVGMIHITQSAAYLKARFAAVRDAMARRALRRFGGIWVANPDNRYRELTAFLGGGAEIREVPNGVDLPDLEAIRTAGRAVRADLGVADDKVLVLAVGRVTFQKRPDRFLEVAGKVRASHPKVRFLWVGAGDWDDEWERRVTARGLGDVLTRVGWQDDVSRYYGAADVFLHPAEYEGLPYAVLEALAAGLPVVLSDRLRRDLTSLGEQTTVAVENEPAFHALLKDPETRAAAARYSRQAAEERYSIGAVAGLWEGFYADAGAGGA
ncbi:MAG: glycosyltransferase [Opitutales bacterium]|nr:glycosyltransferase [Opitutales bacterium]